MPKLQLNSCQQWRSLYILKNIDMIKAKGALSIVDMDICMLLDNWI
jgi:hypothetical protein